MITTMKHYFYLSGLIIFFLSACQNSREINPQSPSYSSSSKSSSVNDGLTNSKVETAVTDMLSDYRLGGSVSIKGIQEIPQQNAAVADLQFSSFQYGTTFEGGLLRAKDFKPKKPSGDMIPSPDEMFPQRAVTYSKDGKAILSRYNDGRWVLKEVRWGFDTGVKGNVEVK